MARKGIAFEQVSAVADTLRAAGQPVTLRSVRDKLGTGSPNTIHRFLKQWEAGTPQAKLPIPDPSPAFITALHAEISQICELELTETHEKLQQANADKDELARAGEHLEEERDELLAKLAEMTKERDTLAGQNALLIADINQMQERLKAEQVAAEAARTELAKGVHQIGALTDRVAVHEAELGRLRTSLEEETRRRIAADQDAAVQKTKAEGMEERLNDLKTQVREAQERTSKAIEEAATLRGQVSTLTQQGGKA